MPFTRRCDLRAFQCDASHRRCDLGLCRCDRAAFVGATLLTLEPFHIAAAHVDSIYSIGGLFYPAEVVNDWSAWLKGDIYVKAMGRGEVFYIAVGQLDGKPAVLGFSSHRVEDNEHRTAIYVRGTASRLGIGSALFRSAEAAAIVAGATSIHVAASFAAVEFYRANGFDEVGRGEHQLWSGRPMPCVFMRKDLAAA